MNTCLGLGSEPLDFLWWHVGGRSRSYGLGSTGMGAKMHCIAFGGHFWQGAAYRLAVIAYCLRAFVRDIANGAGISGIGS